jgi:Helix-turn-helix domain
MAYMTTEEVAELIRTPESSLRYWRMVGKGPRWFKIGKRVVYDVNELQAWLSRLHDGATIDELAAADEISVAG